MIVTRLNGRLGNQMFQYAAARGLAERLGVPVALDTREVTARGEGVLTRVFDLEIAAPDHLPPARKARPLAYLAWRVAGGRPPFRREQGLGYNVAIEGYGDGSYLHGYWQSERYFDHIADRIRRDFAFPRIADTRNAEMAERIGKTDAVSLHVRRGDYVALDAHGLCNQAYYESALARIIEGMESVSEAIRWLAKFGTRWRAMMRVGDAPIRRAATAKSSSRRERSFERTARAAHMRVLEASGRWAREWQRQQRAAAAERAESGDDDSDARST